MNLSIPVRIVPITRLSEEVLSKGAVSHVAIVDRISGVRVPAPYVSRCGNPKLAK